MPGEDPIRSAIVAIVDPDTRRTLVLRRLDENTDFPSTWCFPGGRAQPGETTGETAVREVLEETGLEVHGLEYLARRVSTGTTGLTYLIDCFLTQMWAGSLIAFPSAEHSEARWLPTDALGHLEPTGPTTRWLAETVASRYPTMG